MFSEGGEISGAAVGCAFLDFSRRWRFSGKIEVESISSCLFCLSALMAVSDSLRQLRLIPPRRSFKF